MPAKSYDRYQFLKNNDGTTTSMPFVAIPSNPSDKYEEWKLGFSRLDKLSQKYYGNPFFDFLILYANWQFKTEFEIPDGATIRIPFPLQKAKDDYELALKAFNNK